MNIKKNLLDLHFHKHLYYKNTILIMLFTYSIAVLIPFITRQLDYRNYLHTISIAMFSFIIISILVLFLMNSSFHLKRIPEEIKKL